MGNYNYEVKDINLAPSGIKKIEWAYRNMPVLRAIESELIEKQPFAGLKISVSVHVEAKTACLARALARGGAEVALTGCNPLSTQDDVAAALASMDIMNVRAAHGAGGDRPRIPEPGPARRDALRRRGPALQDRQVHQFLTGR